MLFETLKKNQFVNLHFRKLITKTLIKVKWFVSYDFIKYQLF